MPVTRCPTLWNGFSSSKTRKEPTCGCTLPRRSAVSGEDPAVVARAERPRDRSWASRRVVWRCLLRWCYGCNCSDAALGDDPALSMSSIAWCWRSLASLASSSDRRRSAASALATAASWRASASSRRRRTTSPRYWSPLLPAASVRSTSAPVALLAALGRSPAASRSARGISQRSFPPWVDMAPCKRRGRHPQTVAS